MEIREITDQKIWDSFITSAAPQSFFQSWNWGEVINKNAKFQMTNDKCLWRFGIYDKESLIGVMQVHRVMAKKGAFLHVRHGPVLSMWNKKTVGLLLDYLKQQAKEHHAHFIRISPLIENSIHNQAFLKNFGCIPSPLHAMDGEYCWVLDLDQSEEELLAGMRKSTRYLVKQAIKLSVVVKESSDINGFLQLYQQTASRHGFIAHEQIREEWEIFTREDAGILLHAYHQDELLASAFIVYYGNQAIYHHGASVKSKIPAAYLLQWEAIKQAKSRGMRCYNFWGIAPSGKPRHPWQGITLFKQGFGGQVQQYLHAHDFPLSPFYGFTYIAETIRRLQRGY